ncbi:hypothetical protein DTL42_00900 [Bremerella cremea]|uniref:Uncharacterized protein n=1 Tax=Bremerella cremea TaxID=1031537 RepID=A0A368KYY8_9BACT|nr:hypothetical protein [Bremerella cremea]RCS55979.1 hypothetical protein DTL42_00900 [Bremerella cremea]
MKTLVTAGLLLLAFACAGCKGQQAQQLNPFNAYGMQRVPPPGTQTFGQPAVTAPNPYYQAPAASQAPTLNGYPQQNPPAQFSPVPGSAPATSQPPSSYGRGQWQSVSQSSSSSGVAPASYTEEVGTQTSTNAATTTSPASAASSGTASSTTTSSSASGNSYTNGMRVNEVTEVTQPLSPPTTATVPYNGWTSPPAAATSTMSSTPQPSRIP